jgi:Flp pilus assembly pilin Flp
MKNRLNQILWTNRGSALMEYGLTSGVIGIMMIAVLIPLGATVRGSFDIVADTSQAIVSNTESISGTSPVGLRNGDAQQGDLYWTGSITAREDPNYGTLFQTTDATGESYQTIRLPGDILDQVDAGQLQATLTWQQRSRTGDNTGGMEIEFRDTDNATLSQVASGMQSTQPGLWVTRSLTMPVSPNTRAARITMKSVQVSSSINNLRLRGIDLSFEPVPPPE